MTTRTKPLAILLITILALLSFAPSLCLAASPQPEKPTKMTIRVEILDHQQFWTYSYITKDSKISKPVAVQVEWSAAAGLAPTKTDLVLSGQRLGKLVITTEKNAIVDIQVNVIDANKVVLGTGSLQIRNKGQEEAFSVALPDTTSPQVTYDTASQPDGR